MSTIRKRKGKYQCIVRTAGYPTITKTFKHKVDAVRFGKDLEIKLIRGEYGLEKKKYPLFKETLGRYCEEIIKHKRSASMESKLVKYILTEQFVNLRLDRVSPKVIALYRDKALRTLKSSSVNRRLAIISHMFTICRKEWDYHIPNPVLSIRRPVNPEPRDRHFSDSELKQLLQGNRASPVMKFIIELAIETALRRSEISRILPEHVKGNTLKVPEGKTGARTIPLTPRAQQLLKNNLPFRMSSNAIHLAWIRLCKFYNIKDAHFHDLRHLSLSRFATKVSVSDCMTISGHKEPRTLLRIYAKSRAVDIATRMRLVRVDGSKLN